jgi:hypothetical protein
VSKTASIADRAYRDGICCPNGAGEFNISVNGEPGANSSSGECRDVVQECSTAGWQYGPQRRRSARCRVRWPRTHTRRFGRCRVSQPVLLLPCLALTRLPSWIICSHSLPIGLIPGDEYQLVILDSVGDGMCCGYRDAFATLHATANDYDPLMTEMYRGHRISNNACIAGQRDQQSC